MAIQEDQGIVAGLQGSQVTSPVRPGAQALHQPDIGDSLSLAQEIAAPVGGAVVHYDDFDFMPVRVSQHRLHRPADPFAFIAGWKDDGYGGFRHH
jgi:hypothetical protein